MLGDTFLEKYLDHNDPVTIIDRKRNYGVKAAAKHPIYENFRVKVSSAIISRDIFNKMSNARGNKIWLQKIVPK